MEKSGASPDVVYEVCQHYDDLHAFLGKSPAARPHFLASSLDSDKTETDTPDEGNICFWSALLLLSSLLLGKARLECYISILHTRTYGPQLMLMHYINLLQNYLF